MGMGPELVSLQAREAARRFRRNKVRRADAGAAWIALHFSQDAILFFSWHPEDYGLCVVAPAEVRELANTAPTRPPLLEAIRAHLVGAELTDAVQVAHDRVLRISFRRALGAGCWQERRLLLEASGRYSNAILLDEGERVVEAAKHIHPDENRYRSVLPGMTYTPPPPLAGLSLDEWIARGASPGELERLVGVGRPLARVLAEEPPTDLCDGLRALRGEAREAASFLYQRLGRYVTAFPTPLSRADALSETSALDAAREAVVLPLLEANVARQRRPILERLAADLRNNARKIEEYETLVAHADDAADLQRYGRLILENLWRIPSRADSAELTEWTEEGEVRRTVPLDPEKTPQQNAERYFAKYRKRKAAQERAKGVLPRLYREREELLEQEALAACHTDAATLAMMAAELFPAKAGKRKGKNEALDGIAPHRKLEFPEADAVLLWGLSAKGNRYVTFRLAGNDDIWLHARNIPGAHVVLRFHSRPGDAERTRMLEIAAACAAYHSKARGEARVAVDYAPRRHVRSIPGGGPAHVTYKEFSTIAVDPALWPRYGEYSPGRREDPREAGCETP